MTIKEAAAFYGVSTQAIYQRIAKVGKKSKDITNAKTGHLTEEGSALLADWFSSDLQQHPSQEREVEKEIDKECARCKELEKDLAALQAENKTLQTQLASMQADKDRLYTLLNQAQQTAQALTVARIGAVNRSGTPPLWERIKIFVMGDKTQKEG